jgi:aryl-alcohol dehydrogenase-like predicted oxidoreductase
MPILKAKLEEWGIEEVVICSSFNKIGYLMSPDKESYVSVAKKNDSSKYQLMAMSTLASGAIPAKEAYEFINQQKVQSVVFGASSRKHIEETVALIKI